MKWLGFLLKFWWIAAELPLADKAGPCQSPSLSSNFTGLKTIVFKWPHWLPDKSIGIRALGLGETKE